MCLNSKMKKTLLTSSWRVTEALSRTDQEKRERGKITDNTDRYVSSVRPYRDDLGRRVRRRWIRRPGLHGSGIHLDGQDLENVVLFRLVSRWIGQGSNQYIRCRWGQDTGEGRRTTLYSYYDRSAHQWKQGTWSKAVRNVRGGGTSDSWSLMEDRSWITSRIGQVTKRNRF